MFRLELLSGAIDDLEAIQNYITRRSGDQVTGRRHVRNLTQRCRELAAQPFQLGQLRPELGSELRSIPFGNYVIFFRYRDDVLQVINVLEGHRDLDRAVGADDDA
ncbi:MAG: type II toxin-antitoxin system RelE/ParE family toxin [Pseudomonadota bacterium]|nr:type II toxin-antitoxin system RelE/ParE family toxin [Pseudomonadota bacterium]